MYRSYTDGPVRDSTVRSLAPSILVVYWLKISLFGTQQMKQFLGTFVGLGHYTP